MSDVTTETGKRLPDFPVIVVHLEDPPGSGLAACCGQPFRPPTWMSTPRWLCTGCANAGKPAAINDFERNIAAIEAEARGELDAAWAEAEAALPPGQTMDLTLESHVDGGRYLAWTMRHTDTAIVRGEGSTPAAALRALAAKLRAR
jgi:hypothetical protein